VEARDRQTDGQDQHMMWPPSRKDGPIMSDGHQISKLIRDVVSVETSRSRDGLETY